jgi:hypothetical protein
MMNVFAEESSLTWEQYGDPWKPGHHFATTDGKYRITPHPSPWEPEDKTKYTWGVEAPLYGDKYYRLIKATATFADAVQHAERDSMSPVWREQDNDCRWCGMPKADLIAYPRWWFGCNLCETAIAAEDGAPKDTPDNEFEPRHD